MKTPAAEVTRKGMSRKKPKRVPMIISLPIRQRRSRLKEIGFVIVKANLGRMIARKETAIASLTGADRTRAPKKGEMLIIGAILPTARKHIERADCVPVSFEILSNN